MYILSTAIIDAYIQILSIIKHQILFNKKTTLYDNADTDPIRKF